PVAVLLLRADRTRGSSNGRTAASGAAYQGSNPCPRTGTVPGGPTRPHSLAVRTSASHAEIPGSSPGGGTETKPSDPNGSGGFSFWASGSLSTRALWRCGIRTKGGPR